MDRSNNFYLWVLLGILSLKAAVMIGLIVSGTIGLGPDEAQYWAWSRALDWGYYSKPPGIAWQIGLGTALFGQSELGVRIVSVVLAFLQSLAIFALANRSGLTERTSFWCALMMALCPVGVLGSLFAITDGGFLLFWTLACAVLCSALHQKRSPNPMLIGILIFAGALFKWPIYSFWIVFLACRYYYFPQLKLSAVVSGVVISLLGLLPSVWWNMHHDWATFRHVFATVQGGSGQAPAGGNPLEFLGSQAILLSPILFVLLLISYFQFIRRFRTLNSALQAAGWMSLIGFLVFFGLSFFQKIQGNWSLALLPTGIILIGWMASEKLVWVKMGVGTSMLILSLATFSSSVPYRMNPLKHNIGWPALEEKLEAIGYNPKEHFLVSDKYQTTSLLSFYSGGQKRAYFMNLQGARKNQFSYWPSLQEEQQGKTGYFIWVENSPHWERDLDTKKAFYAHELSKYFHGVDFIGEVSLVEQNDKTMKGALIFRCQDSNGKIEEQTGRY